MQACKDSKTILTLSRLCPLGQPTIETYTSEDRDYLSVQDALHVALSQLERLIPEFETEIIMFRHDHSHDENPCFKYHAWVAKIIPGEGSQVLWQGPPTDNTTCVLCSILYYVLDLMQKKFRSEPELHHYRDTCDLLEYILDLLVVRYPWLEDQRHRIPWLAFPDIDS
ncbi:hypothetical protein FSARC_14366 [Fusarium sarcochroum]|uniref:Uncharacterized protein n=1 Tax=Fusarium sarcochroum TaxID=1208366 RepID=A0A8H4SUD6_9HYPO|nr:hypothetical protein FSARC_14366 [Fusarium sarcochroum]